MPQRKTGPVEHEAARAMISAAGLRILVQAVVTAADGASTGYTITHKSTCRLLVIHFGAPTPGAGDIRVAYNEAATANHLPLLPQRYFVIDAGWKKDGTVPDTVYFYNTTAGDISLYVVEMA